MLETVIYPMLAVGLIGAVLGIVLSIADTVFKVKVDERIEQVAALLPGYNCGACGFPGCNGLATALVEKEVDDVRKCRPSNEKQRLAIAQYLKETPGPNGEVLNVKA